MKILRYHQIQESVYRNVRNDEEQEIIDVLQEAFDEFSVSKYLRGDKMGVWILWDETREILPPRLQGKNVMAISIVGEYKDSGIVDHLEKISKERLNSLGYELEIVVKEDMIDLTIYHSEST